MSRLRNDDDDRQTSDPLLEPGRLVQFLRTHRIPLDARFAQHYLTDAGVLREMVEACAASPETPVIEIGAGLGVLTRALARFRQQGSAPLIAVEIDRRLIPLLIERVQEFPSVRVVEAHILKVEIATLLSRAGCPKDTPYDVVGNIPYEITGEILRKFLSEPPRPRRLTLLMDDSVAAAIAAQPPNMSIRAVSVQVFAAPRIVRRRIPPLAFTPPPAVRSAIVSLTTHPTPLVTPGEERAFFHLVRAGFSSKRKMLGNTLATSTHLTRAEADAWLTASGIDPRRRAQTLSLEEWRRLLGHAPPDVRGLQSG